MDNAVAWERPGTVLAFDTSGLFLFVAGACPQTWSVSFIHSGVRRALSDGATGAGSGATMP